MHRLNQMKQKPCLGPVMTENRLDLFYGFLSIQWSKITLKIKKTVTVSCCFFLANVFAWWVSDDRWVHNQMWSIVCHTAEEIRHTQTNVWLWVTQSRKQLRNDS